MAVTQNIGQFALNLLKGVTKPAIDYGKFVGESGIQLGRAAADPLMRKSILSPKKMTTEEWRQLGTRQGAFLVPEEKISDRKKIAKTGIKSTAGAAAYTIPGGQTTRVGKILAAAGAGSLAGFGASEEGKEVQGTLGGAATGAATMGIITSKPVQKLATKIGNLATNFGRQSAAKVSKATPSAFQKAAEKGIDINESINKYMPAGSTVDDMVGDISQRGKGGVISNLIKQSESQIDDVLKQSADDIVASTDDILNPLIEQRQKLASVPGNKSKIDALDEFIEETKKIFPEGFTAKKLLEIKRIFDDRFGKSVVDDTGGAVISDAQKKMANTARGILKDKFKDIAEALDVESDLYTLRPILNRAKAIGETQGSTIRRGSLAAVDLTRPGSILDVITSQPRVSSALSKAQTVGEKIGQVGQNLPSLANLPPQLQQLLSTGLTTAAAQQPTTQETMSTETQAPQTENTLAPEQQRAMSIIDQAEARAKGGGQMGGMNITPEMLNLAQLTLPPSEFAKLEDIYNRGQETAEQPKLTEKQRSYQGSIELADEALSLLETGKVKSGIGRGITGKVGEKLGTLSEEEQNYRATISLMRTAVKNALLGSAMSEEEIESIAGAIPEFGDDIKTAKRKLQQLKKNLPKLINPIDTQEQTQEQQLLNLLQQQGINL
jgi:hypothetical protein